MWLLVACQIEIENPEFCANKFLRLVTLLILFILRVCNQFRILVLCTYAYTIFLSFIYRKKNPLNYR